MTPRISSSPTSSQRSRSNVSLFVTNDLGTAQSVVAVVEVHSIEVILANGSPDSPFNGFFSVELTGSAAFPHAIVTLNTPLMSHRIRSFSDGSVDVYMYL